MLAISSSAAQAIKDIVTSSEVAGEGGIRISLEPIDQATAKLDLSLADFPEPGDAALEKEGAKIFLEQTAATVLDGKILDASIEGDKVEFSVVDSQPDPSTNGQLKR
ncbi:MAG: Fe-S cluster assembly protein HesB [Actinomycetota bacterium]